MPEPVIAVDGRLALRGQRGFDGEYLYHVFTELGFMARPYDLHIFGDLTADPEVLRRLRMILPVDLLITPNFLTWEQMAFPQAIHGAALVHAVRPIFSRIPAIMTLFQPITEESSAYRRFTLKRALPKALAVVAVSEAVKEEVGRFGISTDRVVFVPAGVRPGVENPRFPKEPKVLVEPSVYESVREALTAPGLGIDVKPLSTGLESERATELETALAFIATGATAESAWNRLLAQASGCPVVEMIDSPREALAAVTRLMVDADFTRNAAEEGMASAKTETWRKTAQSLHHTYLQALQSLHLL